MHFKVVFCISIVGPLVCPQFWAIAPIIFGSVKKVNFLLKILKRDGFAWNQIPDDKPLGRANKMDRRKGVKTFSKRGILTSKITWPFCLILRHIICNSRLGLARGSDWRLILAIYWQFLAVICFFFFYSFLAFLAILWQRQTNFLPICPNWQVNYIEPTIIYKSFLFPQKI